MEKVKYLLNSKRNIKSVKSDSPIIDAVYMMTSQRLSCLIVLDDGSLSGILTEKDLKDRVIARGIDTESAPVSAVMTRNVETVDVNDDIMSCITSMRNNKCHHLPVVNKDKVVAVLSMKTVMDRIMKNIECERDMLRQYITG